MSKLKTLNYQNINTRGFARAIECQRAQKEGLLGRYIDDWDTRLGRDLTSCVPRLQKCLQITREL